MKRSHSNLTHVELAGELRRSARRAAQPVAGLMEEAAERLSIFAATTPSFHVVSIRTICDEGPTIFEGVMQNGDGFFIRYTRGKLCAFVDDVLSAYDEPGLDDPECISLEEVKDRLRGQFVFSDTRPLLRKVV